MIEMNVLRSPNKEEYTRIIVYKGKDYNYQGNPYISTSESARMPADLLPLYAGEGIIIPPTPSRGTTYSLISIETENSSSRDIETSTAEPIPFRAIETFAAPLTLPFLLNPGEKVNLHVFIDKSLIEVFVNGRQVLCTSVKPGSEDSIGVSIKSRREDAVLLSLDEWQMRSIF